MVKKPEGMTDTAEGQRAAYQAKLAKFTLLAAIQKMETLSPNLRTNSISAAAIAAAILKKVDMPYRVIVGYTTADGDPRARPHVWLYTQGLPSGDGITDLVSLAGLDKQTGKTDSRQVPILGTYMFSHLPHAKRCMYWATPDPPEGYVVEPGGIPLPVLASLTANFEMYFIRGSEALRRARDETLEFAFRKGEEKMAEACERQRQEAAAAAGETTGALRMPPAGPGSSLPPQ